MAHLSTELPPIRSPSFYTHSPIGIPLKHTIGFLLTATILSTTLLGCSMGGKPVDANEQADNVSKDVNALYGGQEAVKNEIGLYDAMARAVKYNIEKRDAVMDEMIASGDISLEALNVLPRANANLSVNSRNQAQHIRARDKFTGADSLPLSQFEDSTTRNANLALSWNTLDAGLGFISTKSASDKARAITERRRKVVQDIAQDVREAYWRAAAAQMLGDRIDGMLKKSKSLTKQLEDAEIRKSNDDIGTLLSLQKRMYDAMQDLLAERDSLATAHIELASLMGLSPSAEFRVDADESKMMAKNSIPSLNTNVRDLEVLALMIRPEMRQQTLLRRVATRDIHKTVLETFPGIGGILGYSYDSNSFLDDESWTNASLGLTQNIMKIFSFPQRYKQAQNNSQRADIERMATTAAVLTQTNIAYTRYQLAQDRYDLLKNMMGVNLRMQDYEKARKENAKDKKSPVYDAQLLAAEMDGLLTRTRLQLAYAEGQNAFGRMVSSVGLDPLPPRVEDKSVDELSTVMQKRFENLDTDTITSLLDKIREKTTLLDGATGVANKIDHPAVQNISASVPVDTKSKMSDNKSL